MSRIGLTVLLAVAGSCSMPERATAANNAIAIAHPASVRNAGPTRDAALATLLARLGRTPAWMQLGYNDSLNFYVDLASIRKAGHKVNMWHLIDFTRPDRVRLGMSITTNAEYDCKEPKARQIVASSYSGNMGRDEVVYSTPEPGKWEPVSPEAAGSMKASLWKFACGKQ